MRTLNAAQATRARRPGIRDIPLVRLRTYTNRDSGTVDETNYFSTEYLTYDYDNTGTQQVFDSLLDSIGPLRHAMNHLQDDISDFPRLNLTLRNAPSGTDDSLWERLAAMTLENAEVTIAEVLLDVGETVADLASYTGDEHTLFYVGSVESIERVTPTEIVLRLVDIAKHYDAQTSWYGNLAGQEAAENDGDVHKGVRWPVVFGSPVSWALRVWQHGLYGALAEAFAAGATPTLDWDVPLGASWRTGEASGIDLTLPGESVNLSASAATTCTVSGRATGGTDIAHADGEPIYENRETYLVSCHGRVAQCHSLALRVRDPVSRRLRRSGSNSSAHVNDNGVPDTSEVAAGFEKSAVQAAGMFRKVAGIDPSWDYWGIGTDGTVRFRGLVVPDSDSTYFASALAEIVKGGDAIRYMIQERLSSLSGTQVTPTLESAWNTTITNNDGASSVDFDVRWLGTTLTHICKSIATLCFGNFVWDAGVARLLMPDVSTGPFVATFGSAVATIGPDQAFGEIESDRKTLSDLVTRVRVNHSFHPSIADSPSVDNEQAYSDFSEATNTQADLGALQDGPAYLNPITADTTHGDAYAEWLAQELGDRRYVFPRVPVDHIVGYDLQLGDIVNIQPKDFASAVKTRVVGWEKDFDTQRHTLSLVQVT